MTQTEITAICDTASLTPSERAVWVSVELGTPLHVLCAVWPTECPRKRGALLQRVNEATKTLRKARGKVADAFPDWRGAGMRSAKDVLVCALNKRLGEDRGKLAEEAGLDRWEVFDCGPNPATRGPLVDAKLMRGGAMLPGARELARQG